MLSDLGTRRLSWRRLGVLLRQLPSSSRFVRAYGGDQFSWDTSDYLLASVVDLLAGANWQRGGGKGLRPTPLPRPGQANPRNETRMGKARPLAEVREILDNWSNDGG